jgi:hemolysin III
MTGTEPTSRARRLDRALLTATLAFGGIALAILAFIAPAARGGRGIIGASLVYGVCLAASCVFSYVYNVIATATRHDFLRFLDHAAIFLLIAGTYTPFAATGLHGPFGVSFMVWVWGLALVGIALKFFLLNAFERAFVAMYLALGWLGVSAIGEMVAKIPAPSLGLIVLGGVIYSGGAIVYARHAGPWSRAIWHACVLAGAATHFAAVLALIVLAT